MLGPYETQPYSRMKVGSQEAVSRSRARLYCGVTRAQIFVVIVNEFLPGGCLEFLGHVELEADHNQMPGKMPPKGHLLAKTLMKREHMAAAEKREIEKDRSKEKAGQV